MTRSNSAVWDEESQRWAIRVQSEGIRRRFYSDVPGRRGKADAERQADEWLKSHTQDEEIRCAQLIEDWLKDYVALGYDDYQYRNLAKNHITPYIGQTRIGRLTEQHMQDVILEAHKKGLSRKSLANIRGCMTCFVKYCRKRGCTTLRPEDLVIPRDAPRFEKRTLQPADIRKLFSSDEMILNNKVVPAWFIHAFRFAAVTGLRPGEVLGLQVSDISGELITIERSVNRKNKLTSGKNENAQRTFRMNSFAMDELSAQRAMLQREGVVSPWLFPWTNGNHARESLFYDHWIVYQKHNGIEPISLYELRHTYVSVNKEMPRELLQMQVGHSTSMDTHGTYSHELDGDLTRAQRISGANFKRIIQCRNPIPFDPKKETGQKVASDS